ncbi:NAD(P)-binding protein [Pleomassaria siparia CBS 279.74]|uniref:NAD(P)-binding protein n=1 Tax=Pleomassaria siparia CBS 279.74 TaxID=1314801 RepID=A0A6G1KQ36_9PLEO|nr:NAD(P)-binding protein [Pleomassaria siparia CBS 279.74]
MPDARKYSSKLANTHILIIGGTSGIGFCVAEASVEAGAHVTISSSNASRVSTSVSALQGSYPSAASRIQGIVADLSSAETLEGEIARLFEETVAGQGGEKRLLLDHVVFTAGDALSVVRLADMNMGTVLQAGQIRFFAPLLIAKYIPRYVVAEHTSSYTITTGSISEKPISDWSVVASFAGGLHAMVRNLALDLKPVRVNGVSPGVVDTELWKMGEEEKKAFMAECAKRTVTGRAGRPEDVAESFMGVLRDGNMSGSVVRTDGGGLIM